MSINFVPHFNNEVSCVFASDDNFAPYLGTAIKSLIENSTKENNYGIYILEEGLSEKHKTALLEFEKENTKIFFINMEEFFSKYGEKEFYICEPYSRAIYNRCFIPEIFKNYTKILYFDCDIIFLKDVAELYNTDLKENCIGAVKDIGLQYALKAKTWEEFRRYAGKTLKIKDLSNYFNSGVILFDIKKLNDMNFMEKFITTLKNYPYLMCPDQDVLNLIFEDKVQFLNLKWNVSAGVLRAENSLEILNNIDFEKSVKNPAIMHFIGLKPWKSPIIPFAEIFYKYARENIFYEKMIYEMIDYKIKQSESEHLKYYHPNGLNKIFSIKNKYSNGKKEKFITIFGFTFIK